MKVTNRSDEIITYELPELRVRRVFNLGETKDIPIEELEALSQQDGGLLLIKENLLIEDKEWVKSHWPEVPIEYFWTVDDVKNCILNDSLDLFEETLEYAPAGVLDLIKYFAWKIPITDLNKIQAIRDITGFDALAAAEVMKDSMPKAEPKKGQRLRKEV